jgi:hypothetical protein
MGLSSAALTSTREAVPSIRALAAENPGVYRPWLAEILHSLANQLRDLGARDEARAVITESVELRRTLATELPDVFLPAVGKGLERLAVIEADLGSHDAARAAAEEAVALLRPAATRQPGACLPLLAKALATLGLRRGAVALIDEGLAAIAEAIALQRKLVADHRERFLPDLATSLFGLAGLQLRAGALAEALLSARGAATLYCDLAVATPAAFGDKLRGALERLRDIRARAAPSRDDDELLSRGAEILSQHHPAPHPGLLPTPPQTGRR